MSITTSYHEMSLLRSILDTSPSGTYNTGDTAHLHLPSSPIYSRPSTSRGRDGDPEFPGIMRATQSHGVSNITVMSQGGYGSDSILWRGKNGSADDLSSRSVLLIHTYNSVIYTCYSSDKLVK